MATATAKDFNTAVRGSLIDQTDGTIAKQVQGKVAEITSSSSSLSLRKDFNTAVRGSLIDQTDGTIGQQITFIEASSGNPINPMDIDISAEIVNPGASE